MAKITALPQLAEATGREIVPVVLDGVTQSLPAGLLLKPQIDAAATYAQAAAAMANYFPTRALGEAGTAVGSSFSTGDDTGTILFYQRVPAGSTEIARMLTPDRLASAEGAGLVGFRLPGAGAVDRAVAARLAEAPYVTDFGAMAGSPYDQAAALQRAIDTMADAGGGILRLPKGRFLIGTALYLRSGITLEGAGRESIIQLVNNTRSDALKLIGTASDPLTSIRLCNFALLGETRFEGGVPTAINGGGVNGVFADDCDCENLWVSGFSDGGIAFLNGSYNAIATCRVRYTAQAISFNANAVDVEGNVAIGNRVSDTGRYNGMHTEGSFGDDTGEGRVYGTTLTANTIISSYEAGINIEHSPGTSCTGNTVIRAGYAGTGIDMGVKIFGSPGVTFTGNTITDSVGYAIVVGANSGNSTVAANTTERNAGGSLLVTDMGFAATFNVRSSGNNFNEQSIAFEGNAQLRPEEIAATSPEALVLRRYSPTKKNLQVVWANGAGPDVWRTGPAVAKDAGADFDFYRDGDQAEATITINGEVIARRAFMVGATRVVGPQGAAVPDAEEGTEITTINAMLARLRDHGLIAI